VATRARCGAGAGWPGGGLAFLAALWLAGGAGVGGVIGGLAAGENGINEQHHLAALAGGHLFNVHHQLLGQVRIGQVGPVGAVGAGLGAGVFVCGWHGGFLSLARRRGYL
jgi:hypothetical protein